MQKIQEKAQRSCSVYALLVLQEFLEKPTKNFHIFISLTYVQKRLELLT